MGGMSTMGSLSTLESARQEDVEEEVVSVQAASASDAQARGG